MPSKTRKMQSLPPEIALWHCRISVDRHPPKGRRRWPATCRSHCAINHPWSHATNARADSPSRALQNGPEANRTGASPSPLREAMQSSAPSVQTNTLNFSGDGDETPQLFFLLVLLLETYNIEGSLLSPATWSLAEALTNRPCWHIAEVALLILSLYPDILFFSCLVTLF